MDLLTKVEMLFKKYTDYTQTTLEEINEKGETIVYYDTEYIEKKRTECINELKTYTTEEIKEFLSLIYDYGYSNGCKYTQEDYQIYD